MYVHAPIDFERKLFHSKMKISYCIYYKSSKNILGQAEKCINTCKMITLNRTIYLHYKSRTVMYMYPNDLLSFYKR